MRAVGSPHDGMDDAAILRAGGLEFITQSLEGIWPDRWINLFLDNTVRLF